MNNATVSPPVKPNKKSSVPMDSIVAGEMSAISLHHMDIVYAVGRGEAKHAIRTRILNGLPTGQEDGFFIGFSPLDLGDIVPKGFFGRLWATFWMLTSLVLVSTFTATMASILTTAQLANSSDIQHLDDLRRVRVGTLAAATSADYLEVNHIKYTDYPELHSLLQALAKGEIDAAVYDKPILVYEIENSSRWHLKVLSLRFAQQLYGFTLPEGSPLREPINQVLLAKIHDPSWKALVDGYLGSDYRQ